MLSHTPSFNVKVIKLIVCNAVVFFQSDNSFKIWYNEMNIHIWHSPSEVAKVSVPSFLYVISKQSFIFSSIESRCNHVSGLLSVKDFDHCRL